MESTVIFGITGGLLSLVGLIAIYVTINSQQNIQKAKEYIWELQAFNYLETEKQFSGDDFNRMEWKLKHYKDLQKAVRPIKIVVALAVVVIVFCGTVWLSFVLHNIESYNDSLFYITIGSVLILFMFIFILISLTQTSFIGNLPKLENLLHIFSSTAGIQMTFISLYHAKLSILNQIHLNKMHISVKFPGPIDLSGATFKLNFNYSALSLEEESEKDFTEQVVRYHASNKPTKTGNVIFIIENFSIKPDEYNHFGEIYIECILEKNEDYEIEASSYFPSIHYPIENLSENDTRLRYAPIFPFSII